MIAIVRKHIQRKKQVDRVLDDNKSELAKTDEKFNKNQDKKASSTHQQKRDEQAFSKEMKNLMQKTVTLHLKNSVTQLQQQAQQQQSSQQQSQLQSENVIILQRSQQDYESDRLNFEMSRVRSMTEKC